MQELVRWNGLGVGMRPNELRDAAERAAVDYGPIAGNPVVWVGGVHPLLTGTAAPVLSAIAVDMAERAALVLPSVPTALAVASLMAVAQSDGSAESHAAILEALKATRGADRMTADEAQSALIGAAVRKARSGELLETDADLYRTDGPPRKVRPRTDGTIKGRLGVSVIGSLEPWNAPGNDMHRVDAAELLTRGNMLLKSTDDESDPYPLVAHGAREHGVLIGTEVRSWELVVDHAPHRVGPFVMAPHEGSHYVNTYGGNGLIVGSLETAKRLSGWQRTSVTYGDPFPTATEALAPLARRMAQDAEPKPAVVDRTRDNITRTPYPRLLVAGCEARGIATHAALRADEWTHDPRTITERANGVPDPRPPRKSWPKSTVVACGHWEHVEPRGRKRVTERASLPTMPYEHAVSLVTNTMRDAIDRKDATARVTVVTDDGYRFAASLNRDARAVLVTVSHDGHKVQRTARRVETIGAILAKHGK